MRQRFVASNHILSPTFQGEKFRVFRSLMICQAVLCAIRASIRAFSRVVKRFSRAGMKVFPKCGYALGSYLCNKENGETLVELWGTEL